MSSSICEVLEQRIAEPSVLRLKLALSGAGAGNDTGGWSFLQGLAGVSSGNNSGKGEVYVHPQAKRPSPKLSPASLAMCTESLGSETGSDSGGDISILSLDSAAAIAHRPRRESSPAVVKNRGRGENAFPPPLTSISRGGSVRVRPRREHGRLIMTAVSVSPERIELCTERSGGRLRIRLLTESSDDSASEQETEYDEGEENDENRGGYFGERCGNVGGKIGIEGYFSTRMSTCKGGGHGKENWERHFGWSPLEPICLS